ncbi:MAG: hypothetical protein Q9174_007524, partial [Haloplaca sp. 1 TL-2023]
RRMTLHALENNDTLPSSASTTKVNGMASPKYKGYHHITWYVGNAKQAACFYVTRFGFKIIAYQGLETGHRNVSAYVVSNGNAIFVFRAPIRTVDNIDKDAPCDQKHLLAEIHAHLSKHGDAVKDVAFEVDDVRNVYKTATDRGAIRVQDPLTEKDEFGEVTTATIKTFGDTTHTLVDKSGYRGVFMPGYRPVNNIDSIEKFLPPVSFITIDHCVGNQDWNKMREACD